MALLFKIISETPLWWLILFIPLIIVGVYFFYKDDYSLSEMPSKIIKLSKILRIIALLLVLLLLLSPLIKWYVVEIKKPIIVVAVDQSQSITLNKDFINQRKLIENLISELKKELGTDFDLQFFSFGENTRFFDSLSFKDKRTDIANLIKTVLNQYEFDNLGALVMLSDGNYNSGENPLYMTYPIKFPIYSVALGDTSLQKDVFISKLIYNQQQYTGTMFRIEAQIKAYNFFGKKLNVRIYKNNEFYDKKQIYISSNSFFTNVPFIISEDNSGVYKYNVIIDSLPGEFIYENNKKTAVVNISKNKQNIAIVSSFPHPDIGAIKYALEKNPALNVYTITPEKVIDSLSKLNSIILYQIPDNNNASLLLKKISEQQIPVLFIVGTQTNLQNFNQLFTYPLITKQKANQFEDVYINLNVPENLFNLTDDIKETFHNLPPLLSHFGTYKIPENAEIIAYQRIKKISTSNPLIMFTEFQGNNKCGIIFGEGLFRWRLAEYLNRQSNEHFSTFINKMILYLLSKQKKERFIVNYKSIYTEGEPLTFEAELYNKIYEPISNADIVLEINKDNQLAYKFTFEKNNPFYSLTITSLPEGEYTWRAKTQVNNEIFSKQGTIVVQKSNLELDNYYANTNLLKQLSLRTNGKFYYLNKDITLINDLKNNKNIVSISNSTEKLSSLIDVKYLLIIVVTLISFEWFFRKFFGSI